MNYHGIDPPHTLPRNNIFNGAFRVSIKIVCCKIIVDKFIKLNAWLLKPEKNICTEVSLVFMGRNFRGFREKQGFVISWGMILSHNMLL